MKPTPKDLDEILFRTVDDDLPSGVSIANKSTHETTSKSIVVRNSEVARIHKHWGGGSKFYVPLEFLSEESAINELLIRIARTTRARIAGDVAEAKDILGRLNLAMAKAQ